MLRTMMTSEVHRARVTQADLHDVGSITVDADLLDAADLLPGELVHVDADNRIVATGDDPAEVAPGADLQRGDAVHGGLVDNPLVAR